MAHMTLNPRTNTITLNAPTLHLHHQQYTFGVLFQGEHFSAMSELSIKLLQMNEKHCRKIQKAQHRFVTLSHCVEFQLL